MNILSISCSTKAGSISIHNGEQLLYEKLWMRSKSHGEIITPSIALALEETKLSPSEIDLINVDRGPGSFTGIRVAINSAKTLAYSNNTPIWAEDSLSIMASQVPFSYKKVLCCLNAFKNEVYFARFEAGKTKWLIKSKPQSIEVSRLASKIDGTHLYIGDGLDNYWEELPSSLTKKLKREPLFANYPRAIDLARLSSRNYKANKTLDWNSLTSLYLKASAAEEKQKKGLLKPLPKL